VDTLTKDTWIALEPVLEPGEDVAAVLHAIGCLLVLTDRRLVLIRDGRTFRPRSGIQVWPLDATLSVRSTPTASQPGRVLIATSRPSSGGHTTARHTTSVFVAADQHRAADRLVSEAHRRIHDRG
jgi:hypothetical protein